MSTPTTPAVNDSVVKILSGQYAEVSRLVTALLDHLAAKRGLDGAIRYERLAPTELKFVFLGATYSVALTPGRNDFTGFKPLTAGLQVWVWAPHAERPEPVGKPLIVSEAHGTLLVNRCNPADNALQFPGDEYGIHLEIIRLAASQHLP